jgi:hypothetical protein
MDDLIVPDDLTDFTINYDLITEIVSSIIVNNKDITNNNILLSIIRLLYNPLFAKDKEIAESEIMIMITSALVYKNRTYERTIAIAQCLFSDFNIKHVLSNIQASALLIKMTLENLEQYQVNQGVLTFLNNIQDDLKLNDKLQQMLEFFEETPGKLLDMLEKHLEGVYNQKKLNIYPRLLVEMSRKSYNSMYKQFCKKV